jgi:hypothetical protein
MMTEGKVVYETKTPGYVVEEWVPEYAWYGDGEIGGYWHSLKGFSNKQHAIQCADEEQGLHPDRRYRVVES